MKNGKKVVITYGTYDLFHFGHEALLRRAKELGDYLIVGITSDAFDNSRGKINVHQSLPERIRAVEETGIADKIIVEEFRGQKISDIRKYGVDVFTVGSDWEGKFDYLKKYCDVVYLSRTQGVSSTELRSDLTTTLKLGIVGNTDVAKRFEVESHAVADIEVSMCDPSNPSALVQTLAQSDAIFISAALDKKASIIRDALYADCHVLCETPVFLSSNEAKELIALAHEKNLVLMQAIKTEYFPAFQHLRVLVESGDIGEVKDIDASFSQAGDDIDKSDIYQGSFYDLASIVMLPVLSFLGSDYKRADFASVYNDNGFSTWTKCNFLFDTATATVKCGRGLKTEGDMTITGTKGYIYVPAPWWKTDYFEVRTEDLRKTKKYFYEFAGEGFRYELLEFVRRIKGVVEYNRALEEENMLAVTALIERFTARDVDVLTEGKYSFGGGETVTLN